MSIFDSPLFGKPTIKIEPIEIKVSENDIEGALIHAANNLGFIYVDSEGQEQEQEVCWSDRIVYDGNGNEVTSRFWSQNFNDKANSKDEDERVDLSLRIKELEKEVQSLKQENDDLKKYVMETEPVFKAAQDAIRSDQSFQPRAVISELLEKLEESMQKLFNLRV